MKNLKRQKMVRVRTYWAILVISFLFALSSNAQTKGSFNGLLQVNSVSNSNDYTLDAVFTDISGVYINRDAQVGDKVIDAKGDIYVVAEIVTGPSGALTLRVTDPRALNVSPAMGKGYIFHPSPNKGYPMFTNQLPEALKSTVFNDFILSVDTDLSSAGGSQTLNLVGSNLSISGGNTVDLSGVSTPDATTLTLGKIQLAGDLAGTAASPTVPGLATKAPLASPTFTGVPTAPTAALGTNTTQLATTAFVLANAGSTPDATTLTLGKIQLAGDLAGTAASPTVPGLATKAPLASPTFTGIPAAPTAAPGTSTTQIATTAFVSAAVGAAGGGDMMKAIYDGAGGVVDGVVDLAEKVTTNANLTGDVTSVGNATTIANNVVTTAKIGNNQVTYGKMQAMTANRLLGSGAAGTAVSEITLGTNLSFSGTTLNATGGLSSIANNTLLGNNTGAAAVPTELTAAQVKTLLSLSKSDVGLGNVENTALSTWTGSTNITTLGTIGTGTWNGTTIAINKGGTGATTATAALTALLPTQAGNANKVLQTDGTTASWSAAGTGDMQKATYDAGGVNGVVDLAETVTTNANLTGDVTSVGNATTIGNNKVTYGKMQAMTANRLLGSGAAGTAVSEITLGTNLSFTGTTLNATGGLASIANNTLLGNNTGAAAVPTELTAAQVKTLLSLSKSDVGLGNVENTALSTWTGSTNITTLGTIGTGTWNGTTIAINKGGTGATTAAGALTALGAAPLASPALTGTPTAPTAALGNNTTQIATTAFVTAAVAAGGGGGGSTLYSADGTITADRTVTQGTNDLTFSSTGAGRTIVDGKFESKGAVYVKVRKITAANWPIVWADDDYILNITVGGAQDIYLPDPSSSNAGRVFIIRNNSLEAGTAGTYSFKGVYTPVNNASIASTRGQMLISDGTSWFVVAGQ